MLVLTAFQIFGPNPNGHSISMEYNKVNRMDQMAFNNTVQYTFAYDPNGNRKSVVDKARNQTWSYGYDHEDRVTRVGAPDGSVQEHTYKVDGKRSSVKVTINGVAHNTEYLYNSAGENDEMLTPGQKKFTFGYDVSGNLNRLVAGNGTVYLYEDQGEFSKITNTQASGQTISSYTYTKDDKDNVWTVTDHNGQKTSYGYDDVGQLLSETVPSAGQVISYGHDPRGNRLKKIVKRSDGTLLQSTDYKYDAANQLTHINGQEIK
jgi:YD repeat-containing protein